MNILYLHGLESKLSAPKRAILVQHGTVYAPDMNYERERVQPMEILQRFNVEFNLVMGSSMGAFNAYCIALAIGRPALMFNPPLAKYKMPDLSNYEPSYTKGGYLMHFALGGRDEVVDPTETLDYLTKYLSELEMQIHIRPECGHRVPLEVFEDEVEKLFHNICA